MLNYSLIFVATYVSSLNNLGKLEHFQREVDDRANIDTSGEGRNRDVKDVDIDNSFIAYHPSTPAS